MASKNLTPLILAAIAVVMLTLSMFIKFGDVETCGNVGGGQECDTGSYKLWNDGEDSWYKSDAWDLDDDGDDDVDGILLVQIGIPFVTAGLAGAAVAAGLLGGSLANPKLGKLGKLVAFIAGGLALVGFVLFEIGVAQVASSFEDFLSEFATDIEVDNQFYGGLSFYTTIIGIVLLGIAGLLAKGGGAARRASSGAATAPAAGGQTRSLRCPQCKSVVQVAPGAKPQCNSCGFGK